MCQVTVSIRKIWLEFQGGAIGCNGLWDVSRILPNIIQKLYIEVNTYEQIYNRLS